MQYILSEEEYKGLVPKSRYNNLRDDMMDKIEKLNNKVLELSCNGKCIKEQGGYCDDCPISGLGTGTCTSIKEYSK